MLSHYLLTVIEAQTNDIVLSNRDVTTENTCHSRGTDKLYCRLNRLFGRNKANVTWKEMSVVSCINSKTLRHFFLQDLNTVLCVLSGVLLVHSVLPLCHPHTEAAQHFFFLFL